MMTQRSKEFDYEARSVAAWKAAAVEADVRPTAGEMIAEWLLEVEGAIEDGEKRMLSAIEGLHMVYLRDTRDQLRRILDAIQQARGGTKPTA